jgi:protein-S-isoprenylcysteine O-methyltransferase Ste14
VTVAAKAKLYDLAAALPVLAWYAYGIWRDVPALYASFATLLAGPFDLLLMAQASARLSYMAFAGFLIVLLFLRSTPVCKSHGVMPRVTAVLGAFLAVGFQYLPPANLSVLPALIAMAFIVKGMILSIYTVWWLGRSFSIVPEARKLVTAGPYAYVRHPLYAFEEIAIIGTAMQFAQPWSGLLLVTHFAFQIARMRYEERILAQAFPEYLAYSARTARLLPEIY